MKYDFTKVQREMAEAGMTLTELAERINKDRGEEDQVHVSTLGKAFQRGSASPRVAKAVAEVFELPLKRLLPRKTA